MFLGINILILVRCFVSTIKVAKERDYEDLDLTFLTGLGVYGILTLVQYAITLIIQNV